jgi:hypothetical protein
MDEPDDHERPQRVASKDLTAVDAKLLTAPLRLLPLYDPPQVEDRRSPDRPFDLRAQTPDAPAVVLRVGKQDFRHVCSAVGTAIEPASVVVALSEERRVVAEASRAAGRAQVPFGTDPVFFRCVLPKTRISASLGKLRYAPTVEHGPWLPHELSAEAVTRLTREVFAEQSGRQRGVWIGATAAVSGLDDGSLLLAETLLEASLKTRSTWGRDALLAPLVVNIGAFTTFESQLQLAQALNRHKPEAYVVALAGLNAGSGPERIATAMRLLLILQASGIPVLLARAGPLRHWAVAFGLAGYETGLGRLERFDLGDFRGSGGAGSWPAKFEIPPVLTALRPEIAGRVLASNALAAETCGCDACVAGWKSADAEATVVHDASVITDEISAATGHAVDHRVRDLRRRISEARHMIDDLFEAGVDIRRHTTHLGTWAQALELAIQWGLDDTDGLQRQVRQAA